MKSLPPSWFIPLIPVELEIKEADYRVAVTDVLHDSIAGGCQQDAKVIMISTDQSTQEAWATFCHEFLHGIEEEFGVKIGERKIRKLEYGVAQVMKQVIWYNLQNYKKPKLPK